MAHDLLCRQCRARPVMDRCDICEECWYAPRHAKECEDYAFVFHAATGGDAECICHLVPKAAA